MAHKRQDQAMGLRHGRSRHMCYTTTPEQEKYQLLREFYESLGASEAFALLEPEAVVPVTELSVVDTCVGDGGEEEEAGPQTVVFDDIRPTAGQLGPIKEYFSAGRHRGVTAVFLAQSYFDVPKYVRRNAGCLVFMPGLDNRDVREIAADHCCAPLPRGQVEAAYREATAKPFYFVIDNTAGPALPLRFRKRFNGPLLHPQGGEPLC